MKNVAAYWGKGLFQVTFAVIVGVLCSVALVSAATTNSTNIATDGNLSVTGTAAVTGKSTLGNASSTVLSANYAQFGGTATSTFALNGAVTMPSTLAVTGLASFNGNASTTGFTSTGSVWVNGYATTTSSNGNFATAGTLAVTGGTTLSSTLAVTGTTTLTTSLAIGSSTPTSIGSNVLIVNGTVATTSVIVATQDSVKGGCIQFEAPGSGSGWFRAYATTAGPLYVESGTCQ